MNKCIENGISDDIMINFTQKEILDSTDEKYMQHFELQDLIPYMHKYFCYFDFKVNIDKQHWYDNAYEHNHF